VRGAGAFPEGQRNAGLTQLAGTMRRKGMGQAAIEAALLAENNARCNPPLPEDEVRRIAASVARYAPAPAPALPGSSPPAPADERASPIEWPDPVLPGALRTPDIPAALLPAWVGDMAAAVATWSQTPPAMSVMMALSVLAAVLQRRFEVSPWGDDYREPLALWTLTALPSGSRKTAVINALAEPLVRWEKLERDRLRTDIARAYAQRDVAQKRIEKLKADAAKAESAESRARLQDEIQREREEMPGELYAPRVFTGDVTSERLQSLLVEHDERMTVLTDEGGIFNIMAGQYSGGVASLDVFLQGHSGTAMRVDRAGRLAHLDRPALSFGLALQPGVLATVAKNNRFRDSGLLARFLYAVPKSNVGSRDVRARSRIPLEVRHAWESNIVSLLESMQRPVGAPRVVAFSDAALERWLQFYEYIEANQGEGARWEHMADWTAKLPGAVARIAALLELAAQGVMARDVSDESVHRAIEICRRLTLHAEAAFRLMGAADAESDALALLRWVQSMRLHEFTRHEAHKALEGRFRTLERLLGAIRLLQDWNVLGPERQRRNPRARPTAVYSVNPKLFVDISS
jgi:putative DNA primase/helicase